MRLKHFVVVVFLLAITSAGIARADDGLPREVTSQIRAPLAQVGYGTYRKFGFSVYRATLWAPNGTWSADKPYALQIKYTRDVSKDTMVDSVADDIHDQGAANDETLAKWKKTLSDVMPEVKGGDVLIGVAIPGKKSMLFYNGTKIASIEDEAFSKAFFNVWLGDTADGSLKAKLLGQDK